MDESESRNPITIMRLYTMAVLIHADNERFDEAEKLLESKLKDCYKVRHHRVYALYYNLLSEYQDILLAGNYDTEDPKYEQLLDKMLDAIDKTIHYAKRGLSRDDNHLYAKNILAKATILMRSCRGIKRNKRPYRHCKK